MRTKLGLLFLLAVPAAAAAQGTEAISCHPPHQVSRVMDGHAKTPTQGWRTSADLSRMHADRFESASFVRSNVDPSSPDKIYCYYLSPLGEVPFIQIKDVPRGTCEATGWDVDQNNWAQIAWTTTDLDKAKLTCRAS